jgi:hypothetical protein
MVGLNGDVLRWARGPGCPWSYTSRVLPATDPRMRRGECGNSNGGTGTVAGQPNTRCSFEPWRTPRRLYAQAQHALQQSKLES